MLKHVAVGIAQGLGQGGERLRGGRANPPERFGGNHAHAPVDSRRLPGGYENLHLRFRRRAGLPFGSPGGNL